MTCTLYSTGIKDIQFNFPVFISWIIPYLLLGFNKHFTLIIDKK